MMQYLKIFCILYTVLYILDLFETNSKLDSMITWKNKDIVRITCLINKTMDKSPTLVPELTEFEGVLNPVKQ